jgi:hypothetical protein
MINKTLDFSQFNASKLFDVDAALDQIESNSRTALGYIPDQKSREIAQNINEASIAFIRAQAQAMRTFGEAVKSVIPTK